MQEVFFMYRVIKVLNNNGILVLDDGNGQEQILLGNGVGFGHRMELCIRDRLKGRETGQNRNDCPVFWVDYL